MQTLYVSASYFEKFASLFKSLVWLNLETLEADDEILWSPFNGSLK